MTPTVRARIRVRARNQITIPDEIARAAWIEPGHTLVLEVDPDEPDTLLLRRSRTSYAGVLAGVWGDDPTAWLDRERTSWE